MPRKEDRMEMEKAFGKSKVFITETSNDFTLLDGRIKNR